MLCGESLIDMDAMPGMGKKKELPTLKSNWNDVKFLTFIIYINQDRKKLEFDYFVNFVFPLTFDLQQSL